MSQYDNIVSGSYTADGLSKQIAIPFTPDWFELHIQGNSSGSVWEASGVTPVVKSAWWQAGMADGSALTVQNTTAAATDERVFLASDGIGLFASDATLLGTPFTISGITNASPPVATTTVAHGYTTGDVVILTGTTAALQLASIVYQITVVTPTTFSLINMTAPGSAATAGTVRKVLFPSVFFPQLRYISGVTQAANAVITFTVDHDYQVAETLRFHVPTEFGMVELDGLEGEVISVTASTITVDIDSSAFTAYAFPTSAVASLGTSFGQATPIGQQSTLTSTNLSASFVNNGSRGVLLGATVAGSSGALVVWRATSSIRVYTT